MKRFHGLREWEFGRSPIISAICTAYSSSRTLNQISEVNLECYAAP
jgi:hypothetical protein